MHCEALRVNVYVDKGYISTVNNNYKIILGVKFCKDSF